MKFKRGQVTIFIILAVLVIAGVVAFFVLKDRIIKTEIPSSINPFYTHFISCLESNTLTGIDLLETQGGYIEMPAFEPGSKYMPFSSQLDFFGNPIPYWYYVSGNNIQKEQVPTRYEMEDALESFIEQKIKYCSFETFYEQGYIIHQGEPISSVVIEKNKVKVNLHFPLTIEKGDDTAVISKHDIEIDSNLGNLYSSALKIYNYEQKELFLEKYGEDILRLYAPVDGVELSCSPLIWKADKVFDDLEQAIETNTMALKTTGEDNDYFKIDVDVEGVRFMNSKNWPHTFEVSPSEGSILIAEPIGNQPGLGILGFCYIPYHFVYDMKYPVLVQISEGDETFQFPFAVVIQGNLPREAMPGTAVESDLPEICEYKNTPITINTYDTDLNSVDAEIGFKCAGVRCDIGKTQDGNLETKFPQCANAYITANSEGFEEAEYILSTTEPGSLDIILDRLYELEVELKLDSRTYEDETIITFLSDKGSKTLIYPEDKTIKLSEGQYDVQVYIYKDSSLKISATTTEECVEVPKGNLGGLFGLTEEKCYEFEIPEQVISNALAGGGKQSEYILESDISSSNKIEIRATSLPTPKSLEDLQDNYALFETKKLDLIFR